jgi:hypothetical protein
MKPLLKTPLEHMLQGLAYWLAYKSETVKYMITEHEIVGEAILILQSRLPLGYKIIREYPYRNLSTKYSVHQHADLAIINPNDECECLIEFKLADSTNGGLKSDVAKMNPIKKDCPNVDSYVVVVYRQSCSAKVPKGLVDNDGKANKKPILIGPTSVKVRRVCNAIGSKKANKMKKVVCVELV